MTENTNMRNDIGDEFDLDDLQLEESEKGATTNNSRGFWAVLMGLVVVVIIGLGSLAYFGGYLPQLKGVAPFVFLESNPVPTKPSLPLKQPGSSLPAVPQPVEGILPTQTETRQYEPTTVSIAIPQNTEEARKEVGILDDARTATVAALLTEAASVLTREVPTLQPTSIKTTDFPTVEVTPPADPSSIPTIPVTPVVTALPDTGWADEVGAPFLLFGAVALILLIIILRVFRAARVG